MKFLKTITQLFLVLILMSSCKTINNNKSPLKNTEEIQKEKINTEKTKLEIRISCGEGGISEYLSDGWIILEEYTEEKICTWKSTPATKDCDMEKDKGCKITKPDKIGEEKIYLLEK